MSEETIRAVAGHVSKKMLERYSHIRISAKQVAIAGLEQAFSTISGENPDQGRAQNRARSGTLDEKEIRK